MKKYKLLLAFAFVILSIGCNSITPEMYSGSYSAKGGCYKNNESLYPYYYYNFQIIPAKDNIVNIIGDFGRDHSKIEAVVEKDYLLINDTFTIELRNSIYPFFIHKFTIVHEKATLAGNELKIETTIKVDIIDRELIFQDSTMIKTLLEPYGTEICKDTVIAYKKESEV